MISTIINSNAQLGLLHWPPFIESINWHPLRTSPSIEQLASKEVKNTNSNLTAKTVNKKMRVVD